MLIHDEVPICRFDLCACVIVYESVTRIDLQFVLVTMVPLENKNSKKITVCPQNT